MLCMSCLDITGLCTYYFIKSIRQSGRTMIFDSAHKHIILKKYKTNIR